MMPLGKNNNSFKWLEGKSYAYLYGRVKFSDIFLLPAGPLPLLQYLSTVAVARLPLFGHPIESEGWYSFMAY